VLALIVYQLGSFFGGNGFNAGTAAGVAALGLLVWLLVRKPGKITLPLTEGIRSAA
jgi:ferrous iron transport protein B